MITILCEFLPRNREKNKTFCLLGPADFHFFSHLFLLFSFGFGFVIACTSIDEGANDKQSYGFTPLCLHFFFAIAITWNGIGAGVLFVVYNVYIENRQQEHKTSSMTKSFFVHFHFCRSKVVFFILFSTHTTLQMSCHSYGHIFHQTNKPCHRNRDELYLFVLSNFDACGQNITDEKRKNNKKKNKLRTLKLLLNDLVSLLLLFYFVFYFRCFSLFFCTFFISVSMVFTQTLDRFHIHFRFPCGDCCR